jgi:hypothetical protein
MDRFDLILVLDCCIWVVVAGPFAPHGFALIDPACGLRGSEQDRVKPGKLGQA